MLNATDSRPPRTALRLQSELRNSRHALAFSLIEVVLAVGVISFALVGIIGLFPVAMQSALDSQRETQVAFIARSLFSELQRVNGDRAYITVTKPANDERQALDQGALVTIDLSTSSSSPYDFFFDENGGMLDANGPTALYRADVTVDRSGQPDGLSRVDVEIAVPVTAPAGNQKKYNFVTLINFTTPPAAPPVTP